MQVRLCLTMKYCQALPDLLRSKFVSVRIRMKKMGRSHQAFFRICAIDKRAPRGGRVLEELGTYDPRVPETDARAIMDPERVSYWIGVGAQPSEKVAVLIKKYGKDGTHVAAQKTALEKLAQPKSVPDAGAPASLPKPKRTKAEIAAEAAAAAAAAAAPAESSEAKAEEAAPAEEPAPESA
jgi:small subunit ribosomal protein S16